MTYVVLSIFIVAIGSQLSRLGELRYEPSLRPSRSAAEATSHLFNNSAAQSASQTAVTMLPSMRVNPQGTGTHVKVT